MTDNMGDVFKVIRKSKNLVMEEICDDKVSHSQISRFERGQSEITINKFFTLLKNMCVSLDEFQSIYDNYTLSDEYLFRQELALAYDTKDLNKLRKLASKFEEKRKKEPQKKFYKINIIVIEAIMSDIYGKIIVSQQDIDFLTEYLFEVEDWGRYEVWTFGNSIGVLNDGILNLISESILQKTEFYKNIQQNNRMIYRTVLNLIAHWIKKENKVLALKYINFLDRQNVSVDYFYEKLMLEYNKGYYSYNLGDERGLQKMRECADVFERLGYFDKANSLIKEIRSM